MIASQAGHRARALELGLRRTSMSSCPRRLVGQRHHDDETCWCRSHLNDHGRRYLRNDGAPLVLWEPYDVDPLDLFEVAAYARVDGLRVDITGTSPWNPGHTIAIAFIPKDLDRWRVAMTPERIARGMSRRQRRDYLLARSWQRIGTAAKPPGAWIRPARTAESFTLAAAIRDQLTDEAWHTELDGVPR
jgi:hypothetical protein